jgi:hypothetical protein
MKKNDTTSIWKLISEGKSNLSEADMKELELVIDEKLTTTAFDEIIDEKAFQKVINNSKKRKKTLKVFRTGIIAVLSILLIFASLWFLKVRTIEPPKFATQTMVASIATQVDSSKKQTETMVYQQASLTATAIYQQTLVAPTATLQATQPSPNLTENLQIQKIDFEGRLTEEFCKQDKKICFVQNIPELSAGTYAVFTHLNGLELQGEGKIPLRLIVTQEANNVPGEMTEDGEENKTFDLRECDVSTMAMPCYLGTFDYRGSGLTDSSFGIYYFEQIPTSYLDGKRFSLFMLPEALRSFIGSINELSSEIVTILLPTNSSEITTEIPDNCVDGICDQGVLDQFSTDGNLPLAKYNLSFFTQDEIDITGYQIQVYQNDSSGNRILVLDTPFLETSHQYGLFSMDLSGEYEFEFSDELGNSVDLQNSYLLVWK